MVSENSLRSVCDAVAGFVVVLWGLALGVAVGGLRQAEEPSELGGHVNL